MKLIFLICLLIFALPVRAGDGLTTVYQAYGAGLNLISATMKYRYKNDDFQIQTIAETNGMLKFLLDAKTIFDTNGKNKDNQFDILKSSIETLSKNKQKKRIVDLKSRTGFVDYQTAFLDMMHLEEPQDKIFKVYDGKRELLITFKYQGSKKLAQNEKSVYAGSVEYYTVTIDVTSGKKSGWFFNRMNNKEAPPLHIYFATIENIPQKVMVYSAFDTALFGQIQIFLSQLDYKDTTNAISR